MATHSSVLAWRIPGMGEPGGLLSMGLHRVRHDWSDLAGSAAVPFPVLTVASLTCIQISQEAGKVVWYSHLFKNFPQFVVIHTVQGFGLVNRAEAYVLLELSHFFCDPAGVGNLISGSSAFSKSSLNIWKFTVYILLKPGLENFEHYSASVWVESNYVIVWTFFGIAFLWDWNENCPFLLDLHTDFSRGR